MFAMKTLPKNVAFCAEWPNFFHLPSVNIAGGFWGAGGKFTLSPHQRADSGTICWKSAGSISPVDYMVGASHPIPKNRGSAFGWGWLGSVQLWEPSSPQSALQPGSFMLPTCI